MANLKVMQKILIMIPIKYSLSIILSVLLSSCSFFNDSKDTDNSPVGTWKVTTWQYFSNSSCSGEPDITIYLDSLKQITDFGLDELILGEDIIELPCKDKHYFHIKKEECGGIYPWLKENNTCPLCRHKFPSEEKKIEQEETEPDRIRLPPLVMPTPNMIRNMVHQVVDEQEERMMQEALYSSLSK